MQVIDAIFDPELGYTAFTVERITYTRAIGSTSSRSATSQAMGSIHPGSPEMMQLLPEEERTDAFIAVYTDFALSTGTDTGRSASWQAPDRIRWNGHTWRVVRVRDWSTFGYYQALAVRMREGEDD